MCFAQLTYRESLRDIEASLRALGKESYQLGLRCKVSRSTLADANENRDWRIFRDVCQRLITRARQLYRDEPLALELQETVYALDSSIIDLCLSVFPWANFRRGRAAVKLHTLIDLRGNIPVFIDITRAKQPDVKVLDYLNLEAGAIYVMDRGYLSFKRLYAFNDDFAWFIIRDKKNTKFKRIHSQSVDKTTGVRSDQTGTLDGVYSRYDYPKKIRRVTFFDSESHTRFVFLTNNFRLSALEVAQLYKQRWQIELFFKWIKQHLRIKVFYGTSLNAVKTQIWIAISAYLLVAIAKKELGIQNSLYTILQILSVTAFQKTPIYQTLNATVYTPKTVSSGKQLILF
jgi:hypothetical protein